MTDGDVATNHEAPSKQETRTTTAELSTGGGITSLRDVESTMSSTRPGGGVFDSVGSRYTSENYRRAVGASYVLTMGFSGIVLVALASSLRDLANDIDKTSVQVRVSPCRTSESSI